VPRSMAEALYARARQPKQLEVIRGAGHGGYTQAAPGAYDTLIVEFFRNGLLPRGTEARH